MAQQQMFEVFTDEPNAYRDLLDLTDGWGENYLKMREMNLVPKFLKAPLFALLEITWKCPQRCVYCYNESPRQVEEMSGRQLFKLADQLLELGVFRVCVSGGEPNTRPEYADLVEYLATGGMNVGTITSGWNMTRAKVQQLARYAGAMQVSLDGSTAEIHDAIRRRKGSYDDAVQTIRYIAETGKRPLVSAALTKANLHDLPRIYELCSSLGVGELRTQYMAKVGRAREDGAADYAAFEDYAEVKRFVDEVAKNPGPTKLVFADPSVHIVNGRKIGYVALMRITAEGNISLSPYLDIYFGNLKREPLAKICGRMSQGWHHPTVNALFDNGTITTEHGLIIDRTESPIHLSFEE